MCIRDRIISFFFFFFKQKTAYEIMPSLVGSEMCIRDSFKTGRTEQNYNPAGGNPAGSDAFAFNFMGVRDKPKE